jgi:hypothetical protein
MASKQQRQSGGSSSWDYFDALARQLCAIEEPRRLQPVLGILRLLSVRPILNSLVLFTCQQRRCHNKSGFAMLAADDLHGCAPSFDPGESLPDRAEHLEINAQLIHREVHRRLQPGADNSDKS